MEDLERTSKAERRDSRRRLWEIGGGTLGALGGAGMGFLFGGPAGAAVGALVGGGMGSVTAWAADRGARDAADRDSQLDLEIGVHGPDLGAPHLKHPPPKIGAYSLGSTGTASVGQDSVEADGPIQPPPD